MPKHLELLTLVVPNLSRVAMFINPTNVNHLELLETARSAAVDAKLEILPIKVGQISDIEIAFDAIKKAGAGALLVEPDPSFNSNALNIASHAAQHHVPSIFAAREFVEAGGLISYGDSLSAFFHRAAFYVDKILKGANPAELPVEQPTRFYLVISLKTAKALGLTIPDTLLARADEVIE
jgi:putative tryptophan/tyrosine transport system substrate-binding protein